MEGFDLERHVDRHEAELQRLLDRLPSEAELATLEVTPVEGESLASGTRPATVVRDARDQRYIFKAAEPAHVAAEELASTVRRLGHRPRVPVVGRTLELPGTDAIYGMLQPLVPHGDARLSSDPRLWSLLQREVMLREHPWEWLLANLDTHIDQYILVGASQHPLNIDWDHAMVDIEVTRLTRFTKRSVTIAPLRNLLYDAYANGTMRFSFYGLRREVARILQLDEGKLLEAVKKYCTTAGLAAAATERHCQLFLERKRQMRVVFEELIHSMRRERHEAHQRLGPLRALYRAVTHLRDLWQRVLIVTLHDRLLRRAFGLYKRMLSTRLRSST